jgi:hypothetical protein
MTEEFILDLINEMSPQYVHSTNFKLDDKSVNRRLYLDITLDNHKEEIREDFVPKNTKLYKIKNTFALLYDNKVIYYLKYIEKWYGFLKRKCIQQVVVWRDRKYKETVDFAENIFFKILLKINGTIITDSLQTEDGQGFWDNRVINAYDHGLHIYYINFLAPDKEIIELPTAHDFRKIVDDKDIWGSRNKHQAKRIVISTEKLV